MATKLTTTSGKARAPDAPPGLAQAAGPAGPKVDWEPLIIRVQGARAMQAIARGRTIFRQGDAADSICYLKRGDVKVSVTSEQGKEAIVATLHAGDFFGEGCLAGQALRMATATAVSACAILKIDKAAMTRVLHEEHDMSELFITHLLSRNIRYEEDLVDHLFNSSEKRLARILLLLSHYGKDARQDAIVPRVSQESLAEMVGTTRSRVNQFMNKFRKLGFIDYESSGGLSVNSGLLSVVLHD